MAHIIEDLNWRYAVKKFDRAQKISEEKRDLLIEAFILTPSSFGLQPWKLLYVTNMEKRTAMAKHCWNDSQILESTGVFILTRKTDISDTLVDEYIEFLVAKNAVPRESLSGYEQMMKGFLANLNREQKIAWAERQVMITLGNMLTVAAVEKIDSCPIEGFNKTEIDTIFGLEEK